jgi:hypothetical protein
MHNPETRLLTQLTARQRDTLTRMREANPTLADGDLLRLACSTALAALPKPSQPVPVPAAESYTPEQAAAVLADSEIALANFTLAASRSRAREVSAKAARAALDRMTAIMKVAVSDGCGRALTVVEARAFDAAAAEFTRLCGGNR